MTEYTVHFQKGSTVGARSLRMVQVEAADPRSAEKLAKVQFPNWKATGYRLTRIDHFEGGRIVQD